MREKQGVNKKDNLSENGMDKASAVSFRPLPSQHKNQGRKVLCEPSFPVTILQNTNQREQNASTHNDEDQFDWGQALLQSLIRLYLIHST